MCVILDNSVVAEVFGDRRPPAGEEFFDWINSGGGRLIGGGKLLEELARRDNFSEWWKQAVLAGLATRVDDEAVHQETDRLMDQGACRSNDAHVVALAVVGGARLLYTNDRKLQRDFKDRQLVVCPRHDFTLAASGRRLAETPDFTGDCGRECRSAAEVELQTCSSDTPLVNGPPGKVYSTRRSGNFTRRKRELLATSACRLDHEPRG